MLFRITYYDEQKNNRKFNNNKKVKRSVLTRDIELVNLYLPAHLKIK
ncbi:putative phage protein [Clostridioides difficile P68]|nr:putative phage protein [Clostridioides difficile P13]ERM52284.1 putative phage protein [Clostridioides difficile P68]